MNHDRSSEAGGVIYWIFIAVGLFAALSMTVAKIGRGGNTSMNELASLRATDVMQYAGAIQRGVRGMRINGTDESDICFHADQWGDTDYEFLPQCNVNANRVFSAEGGGISYQAGVDEWYDQSATPPEAKRWVISARYELTNVGTDSGGANTVAANADLIIATGPLELPLCEAINSLAGHSINTPPMVSALTYNELAANKFTGTFSSDTGRIGDNGRERCVAQDNGSGDPEFYFYYKVIIAR